ncbi:glycosyltransferase family 2 protein [Sphingobacterium multivorum]|uniref:glycosyltransferase family 2 protein n=1 Tax=Sphingobacterium multivorum TaxID=28454 RepID=UPI0028969C5F|nr:glycosyltransferase family 2 protein [Sphingobacterium multivorum]
MDIKISVIIPNYNHKVYLEQRINSVLNQTFQEFEVIILDDCSNDDSKAIIENYRANEKVTHIIYNESNSGSTFKQWKKGISLAKGEWIWIAESDDFADSKFLEITMDKANTHNDLSIIYCASEDVNERGLCQGQNSWSEDIEARDWSKDYYYPGKNEIEDCMFYKCTIPNASAVVFKKENIDQDIFPDLIKMRFAGDWLFWIKLLEEGSVYYIASTLNYFRYHQDTTRTSKSPELELKRSQEIFKILRYIKKTYNVSWDYKKHNWLLNEWFHRRRHYKQSLFVNFIPFQYIIILFIKNLKSPFYK